MSSVPVYFALEDQRRCRVALVPVRPFEPGLWAHWPALIEDGLSADQATRLLLAGVER
ncbi:MAG TPA: hypothetical protein VIG35_03640 [Gaiellaceae bacterium]|jgi:hypothetical protein